MPASAILSDLTLPSRHLVHVHMASDIPQHQSQPHVPQESHQVMVIQTTRTPDWQKIAAFITLYEYGILK
jgi:hypothetical protein